MRHAPRGHLVLSRGVGPRTARLAIAGLALTVATALPGPVALAQSATFLRGDYPFIGSNFVVADFNGDARPDLGGMGAMAAVIMLGNGDGTFQPRTQWPVATWAQDLAAGDFDGDGRLDLAVSLSDPNISVSLLKGNGDGTFGAPVNLANPTGFDSPAIVATDVDGDGALDLVLGHGAACFTAPCRIATAISLMRGNGDGTFRPAEVIEVGSSTARIAVGDFDRDGRKDLALASSSSRVHVLLGRGDGTFAQQTLTLTADTFGVEATDVDVADLNRDSIEDLVVAIALNGSRTAILLGNGDGTFAAPRILTEPNLLIPHFQAVADYNGDGFLDLALSLGVGDMGLFEIRRGLGDGNFLAPQRYLVPPDRSSISGYGIVAADFNRDGKPDLALGIVGAAPAFAVLVNSTGTAPPPTPSAPTLLSPANDSRPPQPVRFDWTDVSGAASYQIQVDDSSGFSTPRSVDRVVTASEFTAGTLNAGVRYWWRVRALNAAGTPGPWSSVRRFTAGSFSAPTAPAISAFSVSPSTVVGGNGSQGTVTLSAAAPSGGAVVTLSSTNTSAASVPPSVTIPAGSTSATFAVTTTATTVPIPVTIGGTYAFVTWSVTLTVTPPPAAPAPSSLSTLAVSPSTVTGGANAQGTVTLTSAAPSGGLAVALSSSNAAASVPASVTVPQGATSATFSIGTSAVSASTPVTLTATAAGVTRTTTLTVNAPAQAATLTVTATGRSGERVLSSPTGISVSVGSTGSASFPAGTAITLSVSNGRDAIWSGACSSGGNKTRTCAFTLSANASVSANVQ